MNIYIMISRSLTLDELGVVPDTLSLGPCETYLQFFVWKEMLRVIQLGERTVYLTACVCV